MRSSNEDLTAHLIPSFIYYLCIKKWVYKILKYISYTNSELFTSICIFHKLKYLIKIFEDPLDSPEFCSENNFKVFLAKLSLQSISQFLGFPIGFLIPIIFSDLNCSNILLDPRNFLEQHFISKIYCVNLWF